MKNDESIVLQVGVKILLTNPEGKYLLLHRSLVKYPDVTGRWDVVGGRINPGTTLLDNLAREIAEETGLQLVGEPTLVAAQDILRIPGKHVVRLTYRGEATGAIMLDTTENDECRWFTKTELLALDDLDAYFKELLAKPGLL